MAMLDRQYRLCVVVMIICLKLASSHAFPKGFYEKNRRIFGADYSLGEHCPSGTRIRQPVTRNA
jgi:hypothetical protein